MPGRRSTASPAASSRPGSYELPIGTTLRELLDVAGGMLPGYQFRAALPGGASSMFMDAGELDVPLEFDSLKEINVFFGTGAVTIVDDQTCLVGMTHNLQQFFARESCGWCTPCRDGLPWLVEILGRLESGQGHGGGPSVAGGTDARDLHGNTFCTLALGAVISIESGLKKFREEYEAHVRLGRCPVPVRCLRFSDISAFRTYRKSECMKIIVDNREREVHAQDEDKDLLTALLHLGFEVPYFCWHPALGSVGACRQCAVRVYHDPDDTRGEIEMACMVPVKDGLRLSVEDSEAVLFRRHVIEWLMVNHPHDCPVCDEGGECHLQDMTVLTGHVYRRYQGKKRTYRNQYLGPFVTHEMNRCIQCYRCVRFYREYAGGRDFDVFASKNHVYFGRFEDGPLESEFAGNLVEVCPTGVFTDKTLAQHYTRKWDMETAPSICPHCGLGCNTVPGARLGTLRRVHARFNPDVNGYFLCDRGRYGYEYLNDPARLRRPRSGHGIHEEVDWMRAMVEAHEGLAQCGRAIGIGLSACEPGSELRPPHARRGGGLLHRLLGPRAGRPGRGACHSPRQPGPAASLHEVEWAEAALVLGADPTNEAPLLDLALRRGSFHAALPLSRARGIPDWNDYPVRRRPRRRPRPALSALPHAPKLAEIATETAPRPAAGDRRPGLGNRPRPRRSALRRGPPGRAYREGAHELGHIPWWCAKAPGVPTCFTPPPRSPASSLRVREHPCLLSLLAPDCNSLGLALLGARPTEDAFVALANHEADCAIILENDLYRRFPPRRVTDFLGGLRFLVVLDALFTQTAAAADMVLPVPATVEVTGTYVNLEGRAQRFFQVFVPRGRAAPGLASPSRPHRNDPPRHRPVGECRGRAARAGRGVSGTLRRRRRGAVHLLARLGWSAYRPPT